MSATMPGERARLIDHPSYSVLEKICIHRAAYLTAALNINSAPISNSQRAETLKMLTLYRDDAPGAYILEISGTLASIVDLKLPVIHRRDMKLLMRYPELRRTATWIQMSFVACDDYIHSSGVLYRAYLGALQPLADKLDQKTPQPTPSTPLLTPDEFSATLDKQIEGYEPYAANDKTGIDGRVITRGVRARTEALTFPSTNRKRNLRQLKYYKKKGDLVYPESDPDKRSTFSKWLARDPLFMLPSETQSPLFTRMVADSAKSEGGTYYDGKGTEDAGFPGVSIEKANKKGKERKKGSSAGRTKDTKPEVAPDGQTDAQFLASLEADWTSVGGFGKIDRNVKEQGGPQKEQKTTGARSADVDVHRHAVDGGECPSSAESVPL
jgi:hypothetical protein